MRNNLITDWNWEHYDTWYPVRRFQRISSQQMYEGLRNAYRWFYRRAAVGRRLCKQLGELLAPPAHTGIGYRTHRLQGVLQGVAAGLYLGTNRMMDWRTGISYPAYLQTVCHASNPLVLAQFAKGKPVNQYDAPTRNRELRGESPSRTGQLVGEFAPVEQVPHTVDATVPGGGR